MLCVERTSFYTPVFKIALTSRYIECHVRTSKYSHWWPLQKTMALLGKVDENEHRRWLHSMELNSIARSSLSLEKGPPPSYHRHEGQDCNQPRLARVQFRYNFKSTEAMDLTGWITKVKSLSTLARSALRNIDTENPTTLNSPSTPQIVRGCSQHFVLCSTRLVVTNCIRIGSTKKSMSANAYFSWIPKSKASEFKLPSLSFLFFLIFKITKNQMPGNE